MLFVKMPRKPTGTIFERGSKMKNGSLGPATWKFEDKILF
jgi:hypothetical protein